MNQFVSSYVLTWEFPVEMSDELRVICLNVKKLSDLKDCWAVKWLTTIKM